MRGGPGLPTSVKKSSMGSGRRGEVGRATDRRAVRTSRLLVLGEPPGRGGGPEAGARGGGTGLPPASLREGIERVRWGEARSAGQAVQGRGRSPRLPEVIDAGTGGLDPRGGSVSGLAASFRKSGTTYLRRKAGLSVPAWPPKLPLGDHRGGPADLAELGGVEPLPLGVEVRRESGSRPGPRRRCGRGRRSRTGTSPRRGSARRGATRRRPPRGRRPGGPGPGHSAARSRGRAGPPPRPPRRAGPFERPDGDPRPARLADQERRAIRVGGPPGEHLLGHGRRPRPLVGDVRQVGVPPPPAVPPGDGPDQLRPPALPDDVAEPVRGQVEPPDPVGDQDQRLGVGLGHARPARRTGDRTASSGAWNKACRSRSTTHPGLARGSLADGRRGGARRGGVERDSGRRTQARLA